MKPLTDAEIAELRAACIGEESFALDALMLDGQVLRLLDEVAASRKRAVTAIEYLRDLLRKAGGDLEFTPEGPRLIVPELERARALLKRLERSPREGQGSYGWLECSDCRRSTMTRLPINHEPGCELAAIIGGK